MSKTQTHFHIVVFFYEQRDERGQFQNSTQIDVRSDKEDPVEAVKDALETARKIASAEILDSAGTSRKFFFIKNVVEHDHAVGKPEVM